jgi:hypothetical protein
MSDDCQTKKASWPSTGNRPFGCECVANEPAFVARHPGAPVYHDFEVMSDVAVEGFTFGKITDFDAEVCEEGEALVVARENSRAGLVWEASDKCCSRDSPPEPERWGVWGVSFRHPMTSHNNVRKNLDAILPELKKRCPALSIS